MSVSSGVECIGTALANLSSLGMRRECAPTRKSVMILSDLAAAFVLQTVGVFLLFFYLTVILKLDFGNRLGLSFAISTYGYAFFPLPPVFFIGIAFKCSMHIKMGIALVFMMVNSFFAGLMAATMKDWIAHVCPLFNHINSGCTDFGQSVRIKYVPFPDPLCAQYGHTGCHDTGAVLYFRSDIKEV